MQKQQPQYRLFSGPPKGNGKVITNGFPPPAPVVSGDSSQHFTQQFANSNPFSRPVAIASSAPAVFGTHFAGFAATRHHQPSDVLTVDPSLLLHRKPDPTLTLPPDQSGILSEDDVLFPISMDTEMGGMQQQQDPMTDSNSETVHKTSTNRSVVGNDNFNRSYHQTVPVKQKLSAGTSVSDGTDDFDDSNSFIASPTAATELEMFAIPPNSAASMTMTGTVKQQRISRASSLTSQHIMPSPTTKSTNPRIFPQPIAPANSSMNNGIPFTMISPRDFNNAVSFIDGGGGLGLARSFPGNSSAVLAVSTSIPSAPAKEFGAMTDLQNSNSRGVLQKGVSMDSMSSLDHISLDGNNDMVEHAVALEKQRKRRESHNQVERRRRDHINDKIHELSMIVPECAADQSGRVHKGIVLQKSVEYIRQLQQQQRHLIERLSHAETQLQYY